MISVDGPRPGPTICSEADVERLVRSFYAKVRADALLGPIFEARVHDWEQHILHLVDFWSAMLRGTRRFAGAPMPKHLALPGLEWRLFERWLTLFAATTSEMDNPDMKLLADDAAQRVAAAIWGRYSNRRFPLFG